MTKFLEDCLVQIITAKKKKIQNPSFFNNQREEEEHFIQEVIHYTSCTNESQISPIGC